MLNPWPVFEYQSWVNVASWLRLMAQKKALLSVCPLSVDVPYTGSRKPVDRSSLLIG